jgi:hypothetical protein
MDKEDTEAQWTVHVEAKKIIQNFWYGRLLESYHFSTSEGYYRL